MPSESHIKVVNGLPLSGEPGGVTYKGFIRDTSGDPEWSAVLEEEGLAAQVWTVGSFAGRDLDLFFFDGAVADSGLLIDAVSPTRGPWVLRAYMEFGGGTEALVEVDVVTLGLREFHGQVQARVKQLDAIWRAVDPEDPVVIALTDAEDDDWSTGADYEAPGSEAAGAVITIDPSTPASGTAPNVYQFTIKNTLSRPVTKRSFLVHLGSTTGWTGSTAANTFLFCDGIEIPREIIAIGEARSYVEFVIDRLAPGQTKTYQVLTAGTVAAVTTTAEALTGRYRAPVPDFRWQVFSANATGTTTTINSAAATHPEDNAWVGGRIWALTGPQAGATVKVASNTGVQVVTAEAFAGDPNAGSVGAKFLLMASHLDAGISELILTYAVRHTERTDAPHGLLYQDKSQSRPGDVRDDAADSWKIVRSLDNADDVAAPNVVAVNVGTVDYFTTPDISRTWAKGLRNSNVQQRGGGDGYAYSSPFPIKWWRLNPRFLNPNGVGMLVVGGRQAQAEDFTRYLEYTTIEQTLAQLADTKHTLDADTRHLLFALWPAFGDEIPTSWAGDTGNRSGGGNTTMSDDSKDWVPDQWIGGTWRVTEGKGQGSQRTITDNDENSVTWTDSLNPLGGSTNTPNDSSKYAIRQKPLIANAKAGTIWQVALDISGLTVSAVSLLGAAQRVSVQVRANGGADGDDAHTLLTVGTGSRKLWVVDPQTVVIDTESKTAYVLSGSTVVKDVTDWVQSWEVDADGTALETADWFPIRPGEGTFYTNRTAGEARHAVSIEIKPGYLW